jgi:hypothetical protein
VDDAAEGRLLLMVGTLGAGAIRKRKMWLSLDFIFLLFLGKRKDV